VNYKNKNIVYFWTGTYFTERLKQNTHSDGVILYFVIVHLTEFLKQRGHILLIVLKMLQFWNVVSSARAKQLEVDSQI